jgi:hypothetical protein
MQSSAEFHTTLVLRLVLLLAMILFFFMTLGAYASGSVLRRAAEAFDNLKERKTNAHKKLGYWHPWQ